MTLAIYIRKIYNKLSRATLSIVLAAALLSIVAVSPTGAHDYGPDADSYHSSWKSRPFYLFKRDSTAPKDWHDKALTAYISVQNWGPPYYDGRWERRRIKADAGSGDRWTTDDCKSNKGPLPAGYYSMDLYYKSWGSSVVRGWVWQLPNKKCHNGSVWRTGLFMHSNGYSNSEDHRTEGCIGIGQGSRIRLENYQRGSWDEGNALLRVKDR